jgi:uncharacterized protein YjbI with pentapeptide repeats
MNKLSPSQIQQKQSNFPEKNWSAKKILQRLRSTEIPAELHEIKAHQFYKKRVEIKRDGTREEDWEDAKEYLANNSQDILFWRSKNISIKFWQCVGETLNKFINFFWKTLPASDWVKILATPLILSVATALITNHFQEQSRLNETVNKYFEKMEKLIAEERIIDISKNDIPAKTLIKGESLFALRSIDIRRKEALMSFLSEFGLLDHNKNGISLGYFDLSKINLSGFKLTDIDFNNAVLSKANLSGADLSSANLGGANLSGADLRDANLSSAILGFANLRDAKLSSANLSGANLGYANLSGAILGGAILQDTEFSGLHLDISSLTPTNLSSAILSGAILRCADLSGANLINAILIDANLRAANLFLANLSGANLDGANLDGANLDGANLTGMRNLSPNQIQSAKNWESATYNGKRLDDPEVSKQLGLD